MFLCVGEASRTAVPRAGFLHYYWGRFETAAANIPCRAPLGDMMVASTTCYTGA